MGRGGVWLMGNIASNHFIIIYFLPVAACFCAGVWNGGKGMPPQSPKIKPLTEDVVVTVAQKQELCSTANKSNAINKYILYHWYVTFYI